MEAAFFDLDKTVIAKASMVAFGRPLLSAGMISRPLLVRAMWSHLVFEVLGADEERLRKFRESALRITAGWEQAKIRTIVADNLTEVIEPIVYEEALDLIREHQDAGRRVFIISASPEEIVLPLARYLGVDEAIASRARIDPDGRYTGDVEFYAYGPFKAEAMREAAARLGIDLERSYAYSDSATDVPMLELVGHPVAVNPDRDLARTARERGWEMRTFVNGVPLRDRVSMPPRRNLVAGAAMVVTAGAAAGLAWWWLRRPKPKAPSRPQRVARELRRRFTGEPASPPRVWMPAGRGPIGGLIRRSPAASSPRMRRGRARRRGQGSSS